MTTAKNEAGNTDGGPQMDHPEVVASRIAFGVDEAKPDKPDTKKSAKS